MPKHSRCWLRDLAVFVLLATAMSSCRFAPRSIPESRLTSWSTETFAVSEHHGGLDGGDAIVLKRVQVDALVAWLRTHRHGWKLDFVTHAPMINVYCSYTHLNILDDALVLNARIEPDDAEWSQWRCDVSAKERTALIAAIGLAR